MHWRASQAHQHLHWRRLQPVASSPREPGGGSAGTHAAATQRWGLASPVHRRRRCQRPRRYPLLRPELPQVTAGAPCRVQLAPHPEIGVPADWLVWHWLPLPLTAAILGCPTPSTASQARPCCRVGWHSVLHDGWGYAGESRRRCPPPSRASHPRHVRVSWSDDLRTGCSAYSSVGGMRPSIAAANSHSAVTTDSFSWIAYSNLGPSGCLHTRQLHELCQWCTRHGDVS